MLAFIHMPKAAGTTLANILRRNFGRRHFDTRFFSDRPVFAAADYRRIRWVYPELKSIAGHGVTGTSDLATVVPDIRHFTFVREPMARLLSQYEFNWNCLSEDQRKRWTPDAYFEEVILTEFANVQSRMLAGDEGADRSIAFLVQSNAFIGMTESYDESLVLFREWTGEADLDIRYRSVNETVSVGDSLRSQISQRLANDSALRERANRAVEQDRAVYEFACQRYQEQKSAYGSSLGLDLDRFLQANQAASRIPDDQLASQLYRNLVYKPLRRWIFSKAA